MAYAKLLVRVGFWVIGESCIYFWDTNAQNMAVLSASTVHIINVSLFNEDVSSKTFSKADSFVKYVSNTLLRIIWREAVYASATMKYSDINIKSVRSKNELDAIQLMSLPVSVFI